MQQHHAAVKPAAVEHTAQTVQPGAQWESQDYVLAPVALGVIIVGAVVTYKLTRGFVRFAQNRIGNRPRGW